MIKVMRGKEVKPGVFEYEGTLPGGRVFRGASRQPLLDACRQIKSIWGFSRYTGRLRVGMFREVQTEPFTSCDLDWGSEHTIIERSNMGLRVEKYREYHGGEEAD